MKSKPKVLVAEHRKNKNNMKEVFEDNQEITEAEVKGQTKQTYTEGQFIPVAAIFPSQLISVFSEYDNEYFGAHRYRFLNSTGIGSNELPVYIPSFQELQFVKKLDNGIVIPGVTSEQIVKALIDRHQKLNNRLRSKETETVIYHLEKAIEALERDVVDKLEK